MSIYAYLKGFMSLKLLITSQRESGEDNGNTPVLGRFQLKKKILRMMLQNKCSQGFTKLD